MNIRPETSADYLAIRHVLEQSFEQPAEADLVENLRRLSGYDASLSLVALVDGKIVGHILFSPIEIHSGTQVWPALALAPLAVLPDYQDRGIGSGLALAGLGICRAGEHGIVVVVGEPEYYCRFGFQRASAFGITAPFIVPDEAFMVLELKPDALNAVCGAVRYSRPFEGL